MLRMKIDVLAELKAIGYTTFRLRAEKILSESTMTRLRRRQMIGEASLDTICGLLKCQPGMLIEWLPDDKAE